MLKPAILFAIAVAHAPNCFAVPCEKWEYAKFKDANKKDLAEEYCWSMSMASMNGELLQIARNNIAAGLRTKKDVEDRENDQTSCLRQADEAAAMLMKKYKAAAPNNCPKGKQ